MYASCLALPLLMRVYRDCLASPMRISMSSPAAGETVIRNASAIGARSEALLRLDLSGGTGYDRGLLHRRPAARPRSGAGGEPFRARRHHAPSSGGPPLVVEFGERPGRGKTPRRIDRWEPLGAICPPNRTGGH